MFIPTWALITFAIIFFWSLWLNIDRSKQIRALKFCFYTMSDFAKNKIAQLSNEQIEPTEASSEWEREVVYHLGVLQKHNVDRCPI